MQNVLKHHRDHNDLKVIISRNGLVRIKFENDLHTVEEMLQAVNLMQKIQTKWARV
jgi:hypothetical protein